MLSADDCTSGGVDDGANQCIHHRSSAGIDDRTDCGDHDFPSRHNQYGQFGGIDIGPDRGVDHSSGCGFDNFASFCVEA